MKLSPYFGRIDYKDFELDSNETIYIGRFAFTKEGDYEPVIVDWRTPVASLFYEDTLGKLSYKAPSGEIPVDVTLKRQFIIYNSKLQNVFDTSINVNDEMLQMMLGKNADDRLKDIVMTIQKEQNEIIRKSINSNIIIQGVAGSGKTSIALHRVAYLLYSNRVSLTDTYENIILNKIKQSDIYKNILKFKGSIAFKELIDIYLDNFKNSFHFYDIKYRTAEVISKQEISSNKYLEDDVHRINASFPLFCQSYIKE